MLNYATLKPNEGLLYKSSEEDSYQVLKNEVEGCLGVQVIGNLDIWYDDEFLLKGDELIPTVLIKNSKESTVTNYDVLICGNVVFASHNEEGDTVSLTDEAIETMSNFRRAFLGLNQILVYINH